MSKISNGFLKKVQPCSIEDTQTLAHGLGSLLSKRDVVALKGDLGAGKTTFARFLIQSLMGSEATVPSPTFTLVQTYESKKQEVWHFDLYRLKNPEEIFELGIEDAFLNGITLIEWPEIMKDYLPKTSLILNFEMVYDERCILIEGNEEWQLRLKNLNL